MKNERKNVAAAEADAKTEAEIGARELAREILPLLKEAFVAKCRLTEDGVSMRFPNGQRATVAVWFWKN